MQTTSAVCNIHRDVLPVIPKGLEIFRHNARDAKWDPSKVKLIALPTEWSEAEEFFAVDEEGNFFSASVASAILSSSKKYDLFLEEWRNKTILFMDTVYSKNGIGRFVLVLEHHVDGGWFWKKPKCSISLLHKIKELIEESTQVEA